MIITNTFFPDPKVAAHRVTQWTRWLLRNDWEILVVARNYGFTFDDEVFDNPHSDRLHVKSLGPAATLKKLEQGRGGVIFRCKTAFRKLMSDIMIPDTGVLFWDRHIKQLNELAADFGPEVVLSTSPPHSVHRAARNVSRSCRVPWVADFRDPYTMVRPYQPKYFKRLLLPFARNYEKRIYRDAAMCTFAIPFHQRWASRFVPRYADKFRIIENGIPEELISQDDHESSESPNGETSQIFHPFETDRVLRLTLVGVVGNVALTALARAVKERRSVGENWEMIHAGRVPACRDEVESILGSSVNFHGMVPHADAISLVSKADVLVKCDDPERSKLYGVSSKLFEYLATGKPILLINGSVPDKQLIRRSKNCLVVDRPDAASLSEMLRRILQLQPDSENLNQLRQRYSRRRQSNELDAELRRLLQNTTTEVSVAMTNKTVGLS